MDNYQQEEKVLKKLMVHSRVEMPFQDFEDRMMDQIYTEQVKQKSVRGNIRIAWLFFFLGLFLGLIVINLTANLNELLGVLPAEKIALSLQIVIALILLFQFDRLIGFTFKRKD